MLIRYAFYILAYYFLAYLFVEFFNMGWVEAMALVAFCASAYNSAKRRIGE